MAAVLQLKDKVAIVTGGSSGIGKACTDVFGKILLYLETFFIVFVDLITNVTFDLVFVICVFICKMEFLQTCMKPFNNFATYIYSSYDIFKVILPLNESI